MECTSCGSEMEEGNLIGNSAAGLFYMPDGKNYGLFSSEKKIESKGGIVLGGPYLTSQHKIKVISYVCRSCEKIVVPY